MVKKTKIIFVKPSENNETSINDSIEPQNIDDIRMSIDASRIEIESGVKISLKGLRNWIFIPYNYEYKQNNEKLKIEIEKEGFDVEKINDRS